MAESQNDQMQSALTCDTCEETAEHLCRTCHDRLCSRCKIVHSKSKASYDHEVVLLNSDAISLANEGIISFQQKNMAGFNYGWKVVMWWIGLILIVESPSLNPGYLLDIKVTFIPRNEREIEEQTKGLKCEPESTEGSKLHLTYVISPDHNETRIGCFPQMQVIGKKCLEYNTKEGEIFIQNSNYAPCGDFNLTPCEFNYPSTKSFELFQCFEEYGGILSPKKKQMMIELLIDRESNPTKRIQETDNLTNKTNGTVGQQEDADSHSSNEILAYFRIIFEVLAIILLITFIIAACIQRYLYKVKFGDFWKLWLTSFKLLYSRNVIQEDKDTQTPDLITDKLRLDDVATENRGFEEITTTFLENMEVELENEDTQLVN